MSGPLCDLFGPRKVFGGMLLLGAIPTGLAPLVRGANGLYVVRFFMGILGGSFVPCQVWTTAFFDKNVVGSANALAGGFGNAGGGITYFIMPAVFNAFQDHYGLADGPAWRLTFLVPLVVVLSTGVALLVLCPDTPDGPWADREKQAQQHLAEHHVQGSQDGKPVPVGVEEEEAVDRVITGDGTPDESVPLSDLPTNLEQDKLAHVQQSHSHRHSQHPNTTLGDSSSGSGGTSSPELRTVAHTTSRTSRTTSHEVHLSDAQMLATARGEIVQPPTRAEARHVTLSPHTWALMLTYMCSFGAELAINAVLSAYYLHNFPELGQTGASSWAAMFGFLNFVTRPMGGVVADLLYRRSSSLWVKKHWITLCGVLGGVALVIVGRVDPQYEPTMFGLLALCAVFLEAGNGANFALVPHVHPFANGIVSGLTGAAGNLGGILFSIVFRFVTYANNVPRASPMADYARAFWIIGVVHIGVYVAVSWIPPIPKNQVGGH